VVVVLLMVLAVDVLLLSAVGRLMGEKENMVRVIAAGVMDAFFAGFSMLPGFGFLGHFLWRLCALVLTGLLAYGFSKETFLKLFLFVVLHLSLGGITAEKQQMRSTLLGAAGICFACMIVGRNHNLVTVELTYGTQTLQIKALRDTGNALRDPITGKQVLIVDAAVAEKLTGLTAQMLKDPVASIHVVPGLRLIPYQTVGNTGFLLALRLTDVKIGNRHGNVLVAFSPQRLGKHYQGLTGGAI